MGLYTRKPDHVFEMKACLYCISILGSYMAGEEIHERETRPQHEAQIKKITQNEAEFYKSLIDSAIAKKNNREAIELLVKRLQYLYRQPKLDTNQVSELKAYVSTIGFEKFLLNEINEGNGLLPGDPFTKTSTAQRADDPSLKDMSPSEALEVLKKSAAKENLGLDDATYILHFIVNRLLDPEKISPSSTNEGNAGNRNKLDTPPDLRSVNQRQSAIALAKRVS